MTAKRWEIIDEEFISYTGGTAQLISNGECEVHLWENPKDAQLFCDKLNALNDENEQLKQDNVSLMKLLENQSIIIQKLHSKLLEYQIQEPIVLTKEDLELMGKAISYYTHGRCGE